MNYAELKAEIVGGPLAFDLGPLVAAKDYDGIAAALNAKTVAYKLPVIESRSLRRLIAKAWGGLGADQRSLATFLAAGGFDLDPSDAEDAAMIALFAAGKDAELTDGLRSRAEEAWGAGVQLTGGDVFWALGS